MGLAIVELIMEVEEEFNVEFPALENLERLGDMHEFILKTLADRGESFDAEDVWNRLKRVVMQQSGIVDDDLLVPSSHFVHDLRIN